MANNSTLEPQLGALKTAPEETLRERWKALCPKPYPDHLPRALSAFLSSALVKALPSRLLLSCFARQGRLITRQNWWMPIQNTGWNQSGALSYRHSLNRWHSSRAPSR